MTDEPRTADKILRDLAHYDGFMDPMCADRLVADVAPLLAEVERLSGELADALNAVGYLDAQSKRRRDRLEARALARHQLADILPGGVACTCGADLAALNAPLDDGSIHGEGLALAVHQLREIAPRAKCVADSAAFREWRHARNRLTADVEPLLARLAEVEQENRDLWDQAERVTLREIEALDRLAAADQQNAELRASNHAMIRLIREHGDAAAERDDLRSQLAAAQAQLAEARDQSTTARNLWLASGEQFADMQARLEAVRAIARKWACDHIGFDEIDAALSAPQPEPEMAAVYCENGLHSIPPGRECASCPAASDEPARTKHRCCGPECCPECCGCM